MRQKSILCRISWKLDCFIDNATGKCKDMIACKFQTLHSTLRINSGCQFQQCTIFSEKKTRDGEKLNWTHSKCQWIERTSPFPKNMDTIWFFLWNMCHTALENKKRKHYIATMGPVVPTIIVNNTKVSEKSGKRYDCAIFKIYCGGADSKSAE